MTKGIGVNGSKLAVGCLRTPVLSRVKGSKPAAGVPATKGIAVKGNKLGAVKGSKLAAGVLGLADREVLCALTAATAENKAACSVIAQEFEQYVCSLHQPTTAVHYRRIFYQLFTTHNKTFSAMASNEFVSVMRRIYREAGGKKSLHFLEYSCLAPVPRHRAVEHVSHDVVEGDLQLFLDHLRGDGKQCAARIYEATLRKLARVHRMSLDAMASQEYLERLQALNWKKAAASVVSLCKFRGVCLAPRQFRGVCGLQALNWKKVAASVGAPQQRGKEGSSNLVEEDLQLFLDHLLNEDKLTSARKYENALRKLAHMHRTSLDAMASQEYLDKVRALNWNKVYAASVVSLCKFRDVWMVPQKRGLWCSLPGLQPFLDHLHSKVGTETAYKYDKALRELAHAHRKSLDAMASEKYLDEVKKLEWPTVYALAVAALCQFRSSAEGGYGNFVEGDLQIFLGHLRSQGKQNAAALYGTKLRKLARVHRTSLHAMASREYLDKVRALNWPGTYSASVVSLCKFRGVEVEGGRLGVEQFSSEATHARKRKLPCGDGQERVWESKERFIQDLQPFMDHLHDEKRQTRMAARTYGKALQKLAHVHRKSLDGMASQEYLDKVRKSNWDGQYAESVALLCKFRGVELVSAQHGNAFEETEGLQRFLDHLHSEIGQTKTIQYGQALRTLANMHQKSLYAMASQEYLDEVRKLKWNSTYPAAVRALCKFYGGIATSHVEQREQANVEAQKRLADARASSRVVSDSDILEVLRVLPFAQNTTRWNMMPKDNERVYSTTLGFIPDDGHNTAVISNATAGSENLVGLLCQWLEDQLGEVFLPVTSITISEDYAATHPRRRGENNVGPSAIRALGDGTTRGGLLRYWPTAAAGVNLDRLRDEDSVLLDPNNNVVLFDGDFPHVVTPFEGERYSVVFFTSPRYKEASPECRAEARRLGLLWPTGQLLEEAWAKLDEP